MLNLWRPSKTWRKDSGKEDCERVSETASPPTQPRNPSEKPVASFPHSHGNMGTLQDAVGADFRNQVRKSRMDSQEGREENATERKEVNGDRNQKEKDERRAVPGGEKTETNLNETPEQRSRGSCH
ncbi:hypothetical protein NDU88_000992 [Pleurodeles waltl]|uniref:Uncharacterized protein n=1 Tax=Pleurodeles waltl TaxID=8319 RepID=A0AAV7LXF0_PLEWA|nr:hypothetical protein NDU88_000992 [Pleurodeles waltl]